MIFSQQTASVKNRHTGESGILMSDIAEIDKWKKEGFLVTMDIEKALGSMYYIFLTSALENYYGFGKNFISGVKILLRNQESDIFNGGTTFNDTLLLFFAWERWSNFSFLFILALETLFYL